MLFVLTGSLELVLFYELVSMCRASTSFIYLFFWSPWKGMESTCTGGMLQLTLFYAVAMPGALQ